MVVLILEKVPTGLRGELLAGCCSPGAAFSSAVYREWFGTVFGRRHAKSHEAVAAS